jgi:hypothetical protein
MDLPSDIPARLRYYHHQIIMSPLIGAFIYLLLWDTTQQIITTEYIQTTHFIPEGIAEAFQIFRQNAHVLLKCLSY